MVIASGSTISRAIFSLWSCAPRPFLALARLGRLAFGPLARFALATRLGLGLLTSAVLLFARPRVEQRPSTCFALLGGQGREDDAGLGRGRHGRPRRSGGGR